MMPQFMYPPFDGRTQRHRGPDGRFLPLESALENPYQGLMKHCTSLLNTLMNHKYGYVFNAPVDPVALGVPDYFTVITSPMDLGTIKANLHDSIYSSPLEFASDVRLTFANALKYNPAGDVVHKMAKTLSKVFENKWKRIEKKMAHVDSSGMCYKKPNSPGGGVYESKEVVGMTPESVQTVIQAFTEWKDSIPEPVLNFLERNKTSMDDGGTKMELDLNALSDEQFFELQGLVRSCLEVRDQGFPNALVKIETDASDPTSHMDVDRN